MSLRAENTLSRERSLWRIVLMALMAVTVMASMVYLVTALQYRQQPFIGAVMRHTMIINAALPSGNEVWTGVEAGLRREDLVITFNAELLTANPLDKATAHARYTELLRSHSVGDEVTLGVWRKQANLRPEDACTATDDPTIYRCDVTFALMALPDGDFLSFFALPFVTSVIIMLIGMVVFYYRQYTAEGLAVVAISQLSTWFTGGLFDVGTLGVLVSLWIMQVSLLGGSMLSFSLIFPNRLRVLWRFAWVAYLPLLISLALGATLSVLYNASDELFDTTNIVQYTTFYTIICLMGMMVVMFFLQRPRAITFATRRQADVTLIGLALMVVPASLWLINRFLLTNLGLNLPINFESVIPLYVFPVAAISFALLQHRRIDTDRIISQSITYSIMLAALLMATFLLTLGATIIALDIFNATSIFGISVILFAMVMLFTPFRNRLQDRIDALYFRVRRNYQEKVEEFGQELVALNQYEDIVQRFRVLIDENIAPSAQFIFIQAREGDDFLPYSQQGRDTDVRFSANSSLVQLLKDTESTLAFAPGEPFPASIYKESSRLRILRTQVIVPLKTTTRLTGFVLLAPPRSGKSQYTFEEMRFVNNLATQFAIGTERAQVIGSLEQRVHELDVLSQMGQAVNFTIEFDDLLELIYAQTNRLVKAPCFYIALFDDNTEQLYYGFFLEEDDRDPLKENVRWAVADGLVDEIVRTNKPLRVDNYAFEMDKRNLSITLESPHLRAWMGVPLTAGKRILGVIALAQFKAGVSFSDEQFKIFSDIGALAATSLDKARLFSETKVRERQLTVLNDISRQLVATESDVEKLLQIISKSAVEILNGEAGSLLLTAEDDDTKLEFRVVIGGAGEGLLGSRINRTAGIAGQVVKTSKPLIVNDAAHDPRHKGVTDKFTTQSLLAVPLIAKNNVIGVLEVLNKLDGTFFVQADAELLTTFAGQAAVAIENARLFRMTDLQLAQRVRELETLERIDSELNRTLDLNEVGTITVRSATQTLEAQAGALGIVTDTHLEIVGIVGYEEEDYPPHSEGLKWALDYGIVARVLRTRQPDLVTDVKIDPDYKHGLRNSLSQITIPMFSGDDVNSVLILERTESRFTLNDWAFAQRLAEHASIAIANAQLYAALTRANKSKSEFMGFAAHELKNPLASVKGYADVLMTGMTGELTEQQKNFVGIIHSNANRMQTIIDDLKASAQMDADEFRVDLSPMDVRHAVIETLRPFSQFMSEKGQQLVNSVPDNLPLVMGDETRLIQVLTNLVSNAHKYSPPNTTITISTQVRMHYVDQQGKHRPPMLVIAVTDQGLGISKEDQARMFKEKYFRSSNKVALEQPGTGLGMMLTQGIMNKHNGEIWFDSELGKGSTFYISLPLAPQELQTHMGELASD